MAGSARRRPDRRYERDRPGELLHVAVKKIVRLRGGGWRVYGRDSNIHRNAPCVGCDFIHAVIDGHTRLAYAEIHPTNEAPPAPASCTAPPPTSPRWTSPTSNGS